MTFTQDNAADTAQTLTTALVTDNVDPQGHNRLKIQYPWDSDQNESYWARMITFMSGDGFGAHFVPEIGDEVLVSFLNGDIETPIIMGALWNDERTPPYENTHENSIRAIKSKNGHELILNDEDEGLKIEIKSSQGHKITLDDSGDKLSIEDKGGNSIIIDSSQNSISIDSSMNIQINASGNLDIQSGGNTDIQAGGILTLSGSLVKIN